MFKNIIYQVYMKIFKGFVKHKCLDGGSWSLILLKYVRLLTKNNAFTSYKKKTYKMGFYEKLVKTRSKIWFLD